jgi:hypothetical protein
VGYGDTFVWTTGEQQYFTRVGLGTTPKRCKPCRAEKRGSACGNRRAADETYRPRTDRRGVSAKRVTTAIQQRQGPLALQ